MPTRRKAKKPGIRSLLPSNRCLFCKQETDVKRCCDACNAENFRTCSDCRAMGAPGIHAPRRMIRLYTKPAGADRKRSVYMCYPQCSRSFAYNCVQCHKWYDKTLLHAFRRQEANVNTGLCVGCSEANNSTICASCHGLCTKQEEFRDSTGHKCGSCFSRGNSFEYVHKTFRIVKPKRCTRTFGMELEINNVHKKKELSQAIGKMNVDGVEFCVKGDGSVHQGFEIVSFPADRRTLLRAVKELFRVTRKFKHNYDNCGLHVHVKDDVEVTAKVLKTWCAFEGFVFAFLPDFRVACSYAKPIAWKQGNMAFEQVLRAKDKEDALRCTSGRRYSSMNLCAIAAHGTIEMRLHHATTDYADIFHFITVLDAIWKKAHSDPSTEKLKEWFALSNDARSNEKNFRILGAELGLPDTSIEHLNARRLLYKKHPNVTSKQIGILDRYPIDNGSIAINLTVPQRPRATLTFSDAERMRIQEAEANRLRIQEAELAAIGERARLASTSDRLISTVMNALRRS